MTPTTNTPPVKTTALVVPTQWIETPQGEITTLRRVCVQVTDFYPATLQTLSNPKAKK